jgi:hypothetical protein
VNDLHETMANSHPKLARGQVWCRTCQRTERVDSANCLRTGWSKCCGYTMTIDPPEEWDAKAAMEGGGDG